jgi:hypothetical protein
MAIWDNMKSGASNFQSSWMNEASNIYGHYQSNPGAGRMGKLTNFIHSAGAGNPLVGKIGRGFGVAALGIYGARKVGQGWDRLRNGHVLSSAVSFGMAGAAGYALYKTNLLRNVTRDHLAGVAMQNGALMKGLGRTIRNMR